MIMVVLLTMDKTVKKYSVLQLMNKGTKFKMFT